MPSILSSTFATLFAASAAVATTCDPTAIPHPTQYGLTVQSLTASPVSDYLSTNPVLTIYNKPREADYTEPVSFCNVTVTYTHPGYDFPVHVYIWLPENWNSKFMGVGGGGLAAGFPDTLSVAVSGGYVGANTDGGLNIWDPYAAVTPEAWALLSPGNVDLARLQVLKSRALDDMTQIAKQVTESFYGAKPKYSYWNGCSNGGRQGMMLAQRYPKDYDGILAAAPAVNFDADLMTIFWPAVRTQIEDYVPPLCELDAITAAAVEACDGFDGVKDGIIASLGGCTFDANTAIGLDCCNGTRTISEKAARIANAAYAGPTKGDRPAEWGFTYQAPFSGTANSVCDENNENCSVTPFGPGSTWYTYFLAKDPSYDPLNMTEADYWRFWQQSKQQYASLTRSDDPDLSEFRAEGGKLITWHGLADQLLGANNTARYYDRVLELDPQAKDFYRFFEAPGVEHCYGGPGAHPYDVWQSLVDWVENGKAPDYLDAATLDTAENAFTRLLCPYPEVARYIGGDTTQASSFVCAKDFGHNNSTINHRGL